MAVDIKSKKGIVSKAPHELYMVFTDMRNFLHFLPEDDSTGFQYRYKGHRPCTIFKTAVPG